MEWPRTCHRYRREVDSRPLVPRARSLDGGGEALDRAPACSGRIPRLPDAHPRAPLLLWQPDHVLAAYTTQGERGITNESVWFFPLSALGVLGETEAVFAPAGAPPWAGVVAVALQALALVELLALAWRMRAARIDTALVLAALAPVVFLLTNRIFSPQFLLIVTAGLAFAGALAKLGRREQLTLGTLLMGATFANVFVYRSLRRSSRGRGSRTRRPSSRSPSPR